MIIPPITAADGAYRERPIIPSKTALLSVDMQNEEFSAQMLENSRTPGSPLADKNEFFERMSETVIPSQARLQKAAHDAGIEVIFTVIESLTKDGRDRSLDHIISGLHIPKGSWEAQVIEAVAPGDDDIIIPKTASGVFNATNIEYVLRNLGIEFLIVYGVVTDQCVETTVRDAADRGFLVTQVEDCCAAFSNENHRYSIDAMCGHYCRTRMVDEVIAEFGAVANG